MVVCSTSPVAAAADEAATPTWATCPRAIAWTRTAARRPRTNRRRSSGCDVATSKRRACTALPPDRVRWRRRTSRPRAWRALSRWSSEEAASAVPRAFLAHPATAAARAARLARARPRSTRRRASDASPSRASQRERTGAQQRPRSDQSSRRRSNAEAGKLFATRIGCCAGMLPVTLTLCSQQSASTSRALVASPGSASARAGTIDVDQIVR